MTRIFEIMDHGVNNVIGTPGHVTTLPSFYGIDFIDSRFAPLVACFASIQFSDIICNWQSFNFLTEVGVVYAIMLIESARRANVMTLASMYVSNCI